MRQMRGRSGGREFGRRGGKRGRGRSRVRAPFHQDRTHSGRRCCKEVRFAEVGEGVCVLWMWVGGGVVGVVGRESRKIGSGWRVLWVFGLRLDVLPMLMMEEVRQREYTGG